MVSRNEQERLIEVIEEREKDYERQVAKNLIGPAASSLLVIGRCQSLLGDNQKAQALYSQAASLMEKDFYEFSQGLNPLDLWDRLFWVGWSYYKGKNKSEAIRIEKQLDEKYYQWFKPATEEEIPWVVSGERLLFKWVLEVLPLDILAAEAEKVSRWPNIENNFLGMFLLGVLEKNSSKLAKAAHLCQLIIEQEQLKLWYAHKLELEINEIINNLN